MRYVVAVAAPIGGGKTSLVKAIAERINNATTIHYDHYEKSTEKPVQYLLQWIKNGADFNDLPAPGLSNDLAKLKSGQSIIDPVTKTETASKKYIIFEMPLGKASKETAPYIDLLLWIDVPLDIALARKIKEFTSIFLTQPKPETYKNCIMWIDEYLDNYLRVVRDVLYIQKKKVGVNADIILDGQGHFETLVQQATTAILNKIP